MSFAHFNQKEKKMILTNLKHIESLGPKITGVCHIGCGSTPPGEEYYKFGARNFLWADADAAQLIKAYENTRLMKSDTNHEFISGILWNTEEGIEFVIKNNPDYSGLHSFIHETKGGHKETVIKKTLTMKEVSKQKIQNIDFDQINFIRISTNGGEKEIIEGFGDIFDVHPIKYIVLHRNLDALSSEFLKAKEMYDEQVKSVLLEKNFSLTLTGKNAMCEDYVFFRP